MEAREVVVLSAVAAGCFVAGLAVARAFDSIAWPGLGGRILKRPTTLASLLTRAKLKKVFIGLDIGGTLAKCVILEPGGSDGRTPPSIARILGFVRSNSRYGRTGHRDAHLEIRCGNDTLHLVNFATRRMYGAFRLVQPIMEGGERLNLPCTGGGARKYGSALARRLPVAVASHDELGCLVSGLVAMLRENEEESFAVRPDGVEEPRDLRGPTAFPLLLVNIGSGVSIVHVEGPQKWQRVTGSSIGGGTFYGLCNMITGLTRFGDMLQAAADGDNTHVDLTVGDIYGSSGVYKLLPTDIASNFGKALAISKLPGEEEDEEEEREEEARDETGSVRSHDEPCNVRVIPRGDTPGRQGLGSAHSGQKKTVRAEPTHQAAGPEDEASHRKDPTYPRRPRESTDLSIPTTWAEWVPERTAASVAHPGTETAPSEAFASAPVAGRNVVAAETATRHQQQSPVSGEAATSPSGVAESSKWGRRILERRVHHTRRLKLVVPRRRAASLDDTSASGKRGGMEIRPSGVKTATTTSRDAAEGPGEDRLGEMLGSRRAEAGRRGRAGTAAAVRTSTSDSTGLEKAAPSLCPATGGDRSASEEAEPPRPPSGVAASADDEVLGEFWEDGRFRARPEDVCNAALLMVTNQIGQVALLMAKKLGVQRVLFAGSFLRHSGGSSLAQRRLSWALRYWSGGSTEALFLRREGYYGALGALLRGTTEAKAARD